MYGFLKFFLFFLPAETAHRFTVWLLDTFTAFPPTRWLIHRLFVDDDAGHAVEYMGLRFPNPVGLAAGFDKDGKHIRSLSYLGFGFIEVGTVTPLPQLGNPTPRLFRLKKDKALINRMGFNNEGLDNLVATLKAIREEGLPRPIIIGANIGKNKATPNERAAEDYVLCFEALFPYADYFVVNVSSPNTPGLRELQEKEPLTKLLMQLQQRNQEKKNPKPILLKIAPDLNENQIKDIAEIAKKTQLAGLIATNTTIDRTNLKTNLKTVEQIGNGGLSGLPVFERSTEVLSSLRELLGDDFLLIGVGGIYNGNSSYVKIKAGANLLQVYSGFVYEGPSLVKNILNTLKKV